MNWRSALLLLCICIFCRQGAPVTDPNDANTLLALKESWNSAHLPWDGDPCDSHWLGVTCTDSQVTSVILSSMHITGNLPEDIGNLAHLKTLDLSFNKLTGMLPTQIGNLRSLKTLMLQSCSFTGNIPPEIGNLRSLTFLALNGNNLSGEIPPNVGLLSNLYWFDLAFNQLSGPLPVSTDGNRLAAGLDNLTNAAHFHFNNNSFSGNIPKEILNPKMALIHLLLDSNQLTGSIPKEIGLLQNITIIKLDNNKLSGTIPSNISQLATLIELQLDHNDFVGALPNLSTLNALQVLSLGNNAFDSSYVPPWLSELGSLASLDMESGHLRGNLQPDILGLPQLQAVNFDNNSISGTLSFPLVISSQLQLVSFVNNKITIANPDPYKKTLLLQGNPVCDRPNNLAANICSMSIPPPWIPPENTCAVPCEPGLVSKPPLCCCADPFKGVFLFTTPTFRVLNRTLEQQLVESLAFLLDISEDQIGITNGSFDSAETLIVNVSFFPNNEEHWNQSEIHRISSTLGNSLKLAVAFAPFGFGLPHFVPMNSYDFSVTKTHASGLSTGAKIGISAGTAAFAVIILAMCIFAGLQKRRALEKSEPFASWVSSGRDTGDAPKLKGARWFSYAELKKATDNFSEKNEIGSGGYGKVYKGVLLSGEQIAIKRATVNSMQGPAEYKNEIELLSRVHHKNLVGLVGFCFEQGEQVLVYEYMANGTLRQNLLGFHKVRMDWRRRLRIALESARGISYLHDLANPSIIHRDIKSTNILLDEKNVAKVADFGLSKVGPEEGTGKGHVSTQVKGTLGYLDPEYYMTQQLTEKSDVYSFGVVLLELITARQPIENGKYIVREVTAALDRAGMLGLKALLDPQLKDYPLVELQKFLNIALHCVEESAINRPTMSEVVKELEVMAGHDLQGSGSVEVDVEKGGAHPYAADSVLMCSEIDPSFDYSGGYEVPHTVEPK